MQQRPLKMAGLFVLLTAAAITVAAAFAPPKSKKERLNKDFSAELPRVPAKEPADAVASFQVRPGFRMELVASEPLVRDPVAVDFDENGQMFVVELEPYNLYAVKDREAEGLIRMLTDTNDDGRYDRQTVYVDGLKYPTAVACYDGGIFVGAAPELLYCKDTDGDGKADVRKVVYTGFGTDKAGEAHLNSFRWGFDNRFHFSTNLAGGSVRLASDKKAKPVSVRGRGFVFDPRTFEFELTSGGGQHGMSMDDWGRKFVCSNSEPAESLMYDGRYLARNPFLEAPAASVAITPERKFTQLFRISPVEPWRVLRTRLRKEGLVGGSDEGGKPFGFFSGATGVTIYRGDSWLDEYRGNLIVGDVANNIVYRARVSAKGVGVVAKRVDEGAEFVASKDIWFRPVQFANAPDGTLYVLDMYRELIEGAEFLPPDILDHLDPASGTNRGRIYRIVPDRFQPRKQPRLGSATTAELVALLEHRNGWHRDTASRLLYERQDRKAIGPLQKLAAESKLPQGRMHALWALEGLTSLDDELVLAALSDGSADVRKQAVRLAEVRAAKSPVLRAKLTQMVGDSDVGVRYQLAFSLGAFRSASRDAALALLLRNDGADAWFRLAVQSSLSDGADEVFRLLATSAESRKMSHVRQFLSSLAKQIGIASRKNELATVLKSLNEIAATDSALSQVVVRALVSRQKGKARQQLQASGNGSLGRIFKGLIDEARKTVANEKAPIEARVASIRTLGLDEFAAVRELFVPLLELRQPQPIQSAAMETLAKFSHPDVAAMLIDAWRGLSPQLRARATETLLSRTRWIGALFDAIENNAISRADIDPARVKLLASHPDVRVRKRAAKLFAGSQLSPRRDVVHAYQQVLQLKGDVGRGKAFFKTVCSACHRLDGVGTAVGADLKAIANRGAEAVLLNILDPNREVKPSFLNYVLVTDEGRVLTGMIITETANSITIQQADGTSQTVLRIDIDELRSTGVSFMSEGLEKQLDVAAMADLMAYLNSPR